MKIERTLYWFRYEGNRLDHYINRFFPLANLLNRLLNEVYNGKKIKFININFLTEENYAQSPLMLKDQADFRGNSFAYNGIIDYSVFDNLSEHEKKVFLWDRALKYFESAAKTMKNSDFYEAAKYAYKKGVEMNYNPDYIILENEAIIDNKNIKASIWLHFEEDGAMYYRLVLQKNETVILEKELDNCVPGIEFFLVIYKKIEINDDHIIIKGVRDVDYLPLKIDIPRFNVLMTFKKLIKYVPTKKK